jgi:hypothetical protein
MSARPYPTASADADAAAAATAVAFAVTTAAGSEAAAIASHNAALMWRTKTAEAIDTAAWAAVTSVKTAAQVWPGKIDQISHIDMEDDHIHTVISHIISPYPISISRMTISIP